MNAQEDKFEGQELVNDFIKAYNNEDYQSVFELFSAEMQTALPINELTAFLKNLNSNAPVCLITLYDYSGLSIFIAVLTLSIIGTLKKLFLTGKYEFVSLLLYLAMGWLIIFDINSLFSLIDFNAKLLLILGGVSYTFGIIFYAFDKIRYFHSIWHLFVLTGSVLHYFMVLLYII